MRVIAGWAKGRKLQAPRGTATRPTPSRVREALFSMVAAWLPDARVLDLYAGSGALGIEALSRGAAHCVFVERAAPALNALRANLVAVQALSSAQVMALSVERSLPQLLAMAGRFDLVLMDPPYAERRVGQALACLADRGLLRQNGLIVAEHAGAERSPLPPAAYGCIQHRRWGDVAVSLYAHAGASTTS